MSESCDFLFISHRWILPDGGIKLGAEDRTKDFLLQQGYGVGMLEHPLTTADVDYKIPTTSRLWLSKGKDRKLLLEFEVWPSASPWRWLRESAASVRAVAGRLDAGFVTIAADPIAGLSALGMRRRGLARKSVLHFLDYAEKRVSNPILNGAYQSACKRNLRGSDLVLCVSKRMMTRFEKWHPDGAYMFFPNTPLQSECPSVPSDKRNRHDLVLLGVGSEGMKHEMLLAAVAQVAKRHADVKLHVIGGGGGERILTDGAARHGIPGAVIAHGFLPRDESLKITAASRLGVVIYDEKVPWNYYRDSLKIREYAACGLPVVCDRSTSTAQEAAGAGAALLADNADDLAKAMETLLSDDDLYRRMSEAALKWAGENDKRDYLNRLLDKIKSLP